MNSYIKIKNRKIGSDYEPLVIAELGINHGGSLQIAKQMVDAAMRAGAEIVKHQTHIIDDEMSNVAKNIIPGNTKKSIYEVMKSCALNLNDEIELKNYVEACGMIFISTPFSRAAADRLQNMDVSAFKIGSGECNNHPLIEHICQFDKPIIMSTGMNSLESVKKSVKIIKKYNIDFALMHTTNLYPTPFNLVRLGAMQKLMKEFPNIPIGLSDHTTTNHACLSAIAQGASLVERHFTDYMDRKGPDIVCSMDEQECKNLIEGSKIVFQMLGGKKEPLKEEKVTIDFAFATVVSIKEIKKGEKFSKENIWVKRPGTGEIKAESFNKLLGMKSTKDIESDSHIKWSDVSK